MRNGIPKLTVPAFSRERLDAPVRDALATVLPEFLRSRRWFGGKARRIARASFLHVVPIKAEAAVHHWAVVTVEYSDDAREHYGMALGMADGDRAAQIAADPSGEALAWVSGDETGEVVVYESFRGPDLARALLAGIASSSEFRGDGETLLLARPSAAFARLRGHADLEPRALDAEQSNTSLLFGNHLILKMFRRVEPGPNPDLEIGRYLTEQRQFRHTPAVAGWVELIAPDRDPSALAILQEAVENIGDAWEFTLRAVDTFFATQPTRGTTSRAAPAYVDDARLLGQRTAELHRALAAPATDPAFAPEPFTPEAQQALGRAVRQLVYRNFDLLRDRLGTLRDPVSSNAEGLLPRRDEVLRRVDTVLSRPLTALRTRIHGDYHLGQVLRTRDDFVIIDFEGEPAMPLAVRREKHSPLRDVAGMVRSFDYAAHHGANGGSGTPGRATAARRATIAKAWFDAVSRAFLDGYFQAARGAAFLPKDWSETTALLSVHLLQKVVYELGYELNNRPAWVHLPIQGITRLLDDGDSV